MTTRRASTLVDSKTTLRDSGVATAWIRFRACAFVCVGLDFQTNISSSVSAPANAPRDTSSEERVGVGDVTSLTREQALNSREDTHFLSQIESRKEKEIAKQRNGKVEPAWDLLSRCFIVNKNRASAIVIPLFFPHCFLLFHIYLEREMKTCFTITAAPCLTVH